jgi:hypothetical protein
MNLIDLAGRAVEANVMIADRALRVLPARNPLRRVVGSLRFMQAVEGYKDAAAIAAATELGLLDALACGPLEVTELAKAIDAPECNTQVLVESLMSLGLLKAKGDGVALAGLGRQLVSGDEWSVLRAHVEVMRGSWSAWGDLAEATRSGEGHPLLRVYNESNPLTGAYVRWSTALLRGPSQELVDRLDLSGVRRMIAGTVGVSFAKAVIDAKPDVELTVSCLPQLIAELPAALEHWEVPPPAEVIENSGDADDDRWGAHEEYDLVFLARKFAYCGPEHAVSYLRKAAEVIPPSGMVVVWEPLRENWSLMPGQPERLALTDMMLGEGRPLYRKAEIADHMRDAGFEVECHDVANGMSTFFVGRHPREGAGSWS